MREHGRLEDVAGSMARREAVDWDRIGADADSADERRWLENLRLVEALAAAAQASGDDDRTRPLDAAAPARDETPPTLPAWGPLNLLERIGRGGFGDVYRAWDSRLNRPVALKLLRDDVDGIDETDEERILTEARLLARVEHPHVARVYGVDRHEGRAGIWMELVEGTDLRTLVLEGRPLGARDAARLGRDIADALAAVHAADVVHQDVKPQNVVVRPDGRVALMDFGAGRRRRFTSDAGPRLVAGSPRYLAPETLLDNAPPSPASDVYALGATLCFLLTGETPVEGTLVEIARAHRDGTARKPGTLRRDLPADLVAIVDACLAPRATRPATAAEVRDALDAWLAAHAERRPRRRGIWVAAAVLVAVLAVGWALRGRIVPAGPISAQVEMATLDRGGWTPLALNDPITSDDEVELRIQLSRSAHVYVLNRDAEGNTVLLFPMTGGGVRNPLPAGRPISLPGQIGAERMGWAFSPVAGSEDFLVLASAEPLREFEQALTQVATVDVGGGLTVSPVGPSTLDVAFRGVIGMVPAETPAGERDDLFALATQLQDDPPAQLWIQRLRLVNTGR